MVYVRPRQSSFFLNAIERHDYACYGQLIMI